VYRERREGKGTEGRDRGIRRPEGLSYTLSCTDCMALFLLTISYSTIAEVSCYKLSWPKTRISNSTTDDHQIESSHLYGSSSLQLSTPILSFSQQEE